MQFASATGTKIGHSACCIVFDAANGKIVHVHRVVTMEGSHHHSDQTIAERALALAKKHGAKAAALDTIMVETTMLKSRERFAVDLKSRELVAAKRR